LPVNFISFSASLLPNNNALLNWLASIGQDHDHFEVERSIDGKDFVTIGKEYGGNPYTFTDNKSIVGYSYYRIKEVTKTGSSTVSKIVSIYIEPAYFINVYPNPVRDALSINLVSKQVDCLRVEIRDLQGKLVYGGVKNTDRNVSTISINASRWRPQVYIL